MRPASRWASRLRAELGWKVGLSVLLTALFCLPYFLLQRFPPRSPTTLEPGWLDRRVAFDAGWTWVYQSVYLLLPIAPWLARRREHLRRYARGFLYLLLPSLLIFALWPVAGPRPPEAPAGGLYALLVAYDTPLNAFPSLHVGLAAYSVLFGRRLLLEEGAGGAARRAVLLAAGAWLLLIAYATLATKQHYAVDLPAGAAIAWLAHALAWRSPSPAAPATSKSISQRRNPS